MRAELEELNRFVSPNSGMTATAELLNFSPKFSDTTLPDPFPGIGIFAERPITR